MTDDICQCQKCGRLHRRLSAGAPPLHIAAGPEEIPAIFAEKSFWCLSPLISREIEAVSRRARVEGRISEEHSNYLRQLQQCLGAVSTASREFIGNRGQMIPVCEELRCDDEAAP